MLARERSWLLARGIHWMDLVLLAVALVVVDLLPFPWFHEASGVLLFFGGVWVPVRERLGITARAETAMRQARR